MFPSCLFELRIVNIEVVAQSVMQVHWAVLLCPIDILFLWYGFCLGKMEVDYLKSLPVMLGGDDELMDGV